MAGGLGFPERGLGGIGGQQDHDQGVQERGVLILEVAEGFRDRVQMVPGMLPIIIGGIMPVGIAPAPLPDDYLTVLGSQTDAHMAAERLAVSVRGNAEGGLARRAVACLVQAVAAGNWVAARKLVDLASAEHPNRNLCLDAARALDLKDLAAQYAAHTELILANDTLYVIEDAIRLGNRQAVNVLIVTAESNLDAVLAADRLLHDGGAVHPEDQRRLAELCAAKLEEAEAQFH